MCNYCFNMEAKSFPSEREYLEFDQILFDKIFNKKEMKIHSRGNHDYVYECLKCQQFWELRTPDLADRGYFKPIT